MNLEKELELLTVAVNRVADLLELQANNTVEPEKKETRGRKTNKEKKQIEADKQKEQELIEEEAVLKEAADPASVVISAERATEINKTMMGVAQNLGSVEEIKELLIQFRIEGVSFLKQNEEESFLKQLGAL